jgi:hypothetical protein
MSLDQPIASPCVSICALNDDDICIGCYRSADEILRWGKMNEDQKRAVYINIEKRTTEAGAWLGVDGVSD